MKLKNNRKRIERTARLNKKAFAQKCVDNLRRKATVYEKRFYTILREKHKSTVFQKAFFNGEKVYIVDFWIPTKMTVIELDGSQHYEPNHRYKDNLRDCFFDEIGVKVIRLQNKEIDYMT